MGAFTSNDVSINYRCAGEGTDVVLVHGLAANHAFWHMNVLLPLARDHRVTVYDLRGHGYSSMPPSGYSTADMAEDLHQLLIHLGIDGAHIVGHSFGGAVALHYASLYPERVVSLTVADARIRAVQPTQCPRDWPNWELAKKQLGALGLFIPEDESDSGIWLLEKLAAPEWQKARDKLKGSPLSIPFSPWGGGNRSAERWRELLETTTARGELTSTAGLTLASLAEIRQPVLAAYGELSMVLPSLEGMKQCLPNCRTVIVPGAGHFFPLSRPDAFVTTVRRFLEDLREEG